MIIQPTDWVWFTFNEATQFGEFSYLHPELQYSLNRLFKREGKTYNMFNPNEYLCLHMVFPNETSKYAEKLHFLFEGANKPNFDISRLPSGRHWLHGESPKFGPISSLNSDLGYAGKKRLYYNYIEWLCKFIVLPEPPVFKERKADNYWEKHSQEIKTLLQRLKNKQKLEESPMKVKQYLIELNSYDKEKKQITGNREAVLVKFKESYPTSPVDIILLLESMFINADDNYDMTQSILTIGDGSYKLGSGNTEYTDERFKLLTDAKGLFEEVDMTSPTVYKFYFKGEKKGKLLGTGEEYIRIPRNVSIKQVLKFYQQKYPNKNYSLNKNSIKKELSERSKKLEDLPHKGETSSKQLRKVCYKKKDGGKIFRGLFEKVQKLVDSGDYEFTSKLAWKRQGEAYKSNIAHPPDTGRKIGDRKKRKEMNDNRRQLDTIMKLNQQRIRRSKRKPGDAERKLQSEKDKKKYAEKCKSSNKQRVSHPVSRAFEAVILGDRAEVLATLNIKATSSAHAEKALKSIMKNKSKNAKLTGTVREWIKQTSKNRVSST